LKKKKECIVCGNTKASELEETTLFSDADGNDVEENAWCCKEGKGCS